MNPSEALREGKSNNILVFLGLRPRPKGTALAEGVRARETLTMISLQNFRYLQIINSAFSSCLYLLKLTKYRLRTIFR